MNDTDQNKQDMTQTIQDESGPALPAPGQVLQKRREELGLSQTQVAEALHMTVHYVRALENDQYEKLPGKTFVKGYFRSYARFLGADVDALMDCYQKYTDVLTASDVTEADDIRARKAYDQNIRWLICAAVIIVVVVGISWWFSGEGETTGSVANTRPVAVAANSQARAERLMPPVAEPETTAGQSVAVTPVTADVVMDTENVSGQDQVPDSMPSVEADSGVAAVADETQLVPAGSGESGTDIVTEVLQTELAELASAVDSRPGEQGAEIVSPSDMPEYTVTRVEDHRRVELESDGEDILDVHFSGASWIEIDNADNDRLYHDMLRSGDELSIRGKAPFNILIGDANMVDIRFNSRPVQISRIRSDNSVRIKLEPETR